MSKLSKYIKKYTQKCHSIMRTQINTWIEMLYIKTITEQCGKCSITFPKAHRTRAGLYPDCPTEYGPYLCRKCAAPFTAQKRKLAEREEECEIPRRSKRPKSSNVLYGLILVKYILTTFQHQKNQVGTYPTRKVLLPKERTSIPSKTTWGAVEKFVGGSS